MSVAWGFSEELGGFVVYRDNADGSYTPLVSPGTGQPAEKEVANTVLAPTLHQTIASTGALAGGRYRVVAYAFSDDTPALGKNLQLVLDFGGTMRVLVGPVGALLAWQLPDVSITAGNSVFVQSGAAGAAGASYAAYIAAYPLP